MWQTVGGIICSYLLPTHVNKCKYGIRSQRHVFTPSAKRNFFVTSSTLVTDSPHIIHVLSQADHLLTLAPVVQTERPRLIGGGNEQGGSGGGGRAQQQQPRQGDDDEAELRRAMAMSMQR